MFCCMLKIQKSPSIPVVKTKLVTWSFFSVVFGGRRIISIWFSSMTATSSFGGHLNLESAILRANFMLSLSSEILRTWATNRFMFYFPAYFTNSQSSIASFLLIKLSLSVLSSTDIIELMLAIE